MKSTLLICMSFFTFFGLAPSRGSEIGDAAPTPSSVTDDGQPFHFADIYKKGVTLVYFYPKASTPGCTAEACSLRDNFTVLQKRGLQIVGVSEDHPDAQKSFKEKNQLQFPLVADSDGTVAKAFGVPTFLGLAKRQSFLVKDGKVVWRDLSVSPAKHVAEVSKALDSLDGKGEATPK